MRESGEEIRKDVMAGENYKKDGTLKNLNIFERLNKKRTEKNLMYSVPRRY